MIDENDYSHKIIKGTSLAWTEEEIVQHYREAKDQRAMIGILADLNNVSCDKIRKVLKKHGVKTGADVKPKKKRKAAPPAEPIKERKTACQKVYIKLVSGGVSYSVEQIQRRIGRSATYIKTRIKGNDRVVLGGVEYQIMRYEKWSKHGCIGKIETGTEKP